MSEVTRRIVLRVERPVKDGYFSVEISAAFGVTEENEFGAALSVFGDLFNVATIAVSQAGEIAGDPAA